jgi:hypothetical protein
MNYARLAALAALALVAPVSANAATNLVVNGDFDQPGSGGGWTQQAIIPGWFSESGDSIEAGNAGVYGASCRTAGCQLLEVNANRMGSVSQQVTGLRPGAGYTFGWSMAGRDGGGPQHLDVSVDGLLVGTMASSSFGGWIDRAVRFTAQGSTARINFASRNAGGNDSYGNLITNVAVGGVPEPASWAMMIIGFGMVGTVVRRRAAMLA